MLYQVSALVWAELGPAKPQLVCTFSQDPRITFEQVWQCVLHKTVRHDLKVDGANYANTLKTAADKNCKGSKKCKFIIPILR